MRVCVSDFILQLSNSAQSTLMLRQRDVSWAAHWRGRTVMWFVIWGRGGVINLGIHVRRENRWEEETLKSHQIKSLQGLSLWKKGLMWWQSSFQARIYESKSTTKAQTINPQDPGLPGRQVPGITFYFGWESGSHRTLTDPLSNNIYLQRISFIDHHWWSTVSILVSTIWPKLTTMTE